MPRTPDPGGLQYDLRADHVARRREPAYGTFMPTLSKRLGHGRSALTFDWFQADLPSPALARRLQPCTRVWKRKSSIRRRGPGRPIFRAKVLLMFKSSTAINRSVPPANGCDHDERRHAGF